MSVTQFIVDSSPAVTNLYGYKTLKKEVVACKTLIDYSYVSCKLLSNYYGHQADDLLCLAYKRYLRALMEGAECK